MVIDMRANLPGAAITPDTKSRPSVSGAATGTTTAAPAQSQPAKQPTRAAVQAAAQQLQDYLATSGRTLEFRLDDTTGMTVVTVKDTESGDVIRQIPSEEVLHIAKTLRDSGGKSANVLLSLTA
jgi:flagellar protein FlaG